jgi:hypothetical protein
MTPESQLQKDLETAEAAGCQQKPEVQEARRALTIRDKRLIERAAQRVKDILGIKNRYDSIVAWFEQQKATTRDEAIDSPGISHGFHRYHEALKQYGDNWYQIVPLLERVKELLQKAIEEHKETGLALQRLAEKLEPWKEDRRFEYIEFRRKRLIGAYRNGYTATLAEIEKWISEVEKQEKHIAEQDTQKVDTINEYLASQVSRFEETMTVADFKKLQSLTEEVDNPAKRMALWELLRDYENKHATELEMVTIKKSKRPKLSAQQAREGWEALTLLSSSQDLESRRAILSDMRSALQKKQRKRARDGIADSLEKARRLNKEEET